MRVTRSVPSRVRLALPLLVHIVAASALASSARAASIVTDWLDVAIPSANYVTPEPTTASRFFAILHTSMFEAWAAYDDSATGVVTGTILKGSGGESTIVNKREAISHAAYTVLTALAPVRGRFAEAFMREQGYDLGAQTPPAVLGRRAAQAVLDMRNHDGSNQGGEYADTTGYVPGDGSKPDRWLPAASDIMNTGLFEPTTPHWSRVMPFALTAPDQLRPLLPSAYGTPAFAAQIEEILRYSARLTDEQKAIAEYWAPFISNPASHLEALTRFVSLRDDYRLDRDVKLFFIVSNALLDAGIAAWDAKYHYDYIRPYTAIRRLGGRQIVAWDNPNRTQADNHLPASGLTIDWGRARGAAAMKAADWRPYLPTPPFPEYVSGHSTFTAAWARAMELATGSPRFGYTAEWRKLFVEDRWLDEPIRLYYPTFWSAAEASGISRIYGGIHWTAANTEGLALGRKVADRAWHQAQRHISGAASPMTAAALFLQPPIWRPYGAPDTARPAFEVAGGLSIELGQSVDGGAGGSWRTMPLDAMPGGRWRIEAVVNVAQASDASVTVKLQIVDARTSGQALETAQHYIEGARQGIRLAVVMRGGGPDTVRIQLEAEGGNARSVVSLTGIDVRWIEPQAAWAR